MSGSRYIGMRAVTIALSPGGARVGLAAAIPAALSSLACGYGQARLLHSSRLSHTYASTLSAPSSPHSHGSLLSALHSAVEERKEDEDEEEEEEDDVAPAPSLLTAGRKHERRRRRVTLPPLTEDDLECPVYGQLHSLAAVGDVDGMLRAFSPHVLTARLGSWHLLLFTLGSRQRVDDMTALWEQWRSVLPHPVSSAASPCRPTTRCLPTHDTYALLLNCRDFPLSPVHALLQLQARGQSGDTFIYNRYLKDQLRAKRWRQVEAALRAMKKKAVQPDVFTFSCRFSLLDERHGRDRAAFYRAIAALWDEMLGCGLRPPATLTAAFAFQFCEQRDVERVVQAVEAIRGWGPSRSGPNAACLQLMMSCLMRADRLPELLRLYGYCRSIGVQQQPLTFYTLINAFSRHGDTASMALLFQEMLAQGVQPNSRVFYSLLQGHARAGDREGTDAMLQRMAGMGVEPDADAFLCIFHGIRSLYLAQVVARRDAWQQEAREARAQTSVAAVPPLSSLLLPYLAMMDERSLTPLLDSYLLLLSALRHEQDVGSVLRCLHHMASRGVAPDADSLQYAIVQLSMRPWSEQESLHTRQLELLLERVGQPLSLSQEGWSALLLMYRKEQNPAGMEAAYRRMKAAPSAVWIRAEALVELMADCFSCSSAGVRQHERMRFISRLYADLVQTGDQQRLTVRVFDMALQASAVLGDPEAMKATLRRMQAARLAIADSTLAVLEAAREHVLFSAEMQAWLLQEKARLQAERMEQSMKDSIYSERQRSKKAEAGTEVGQLQSADADADAASLVRQLFVLPAWSPLSSLFQTQQAALQPLPTSPPSESASEELQTAITARLSSLPLPVLFASEFPAAVTLNAVAHVEAGPGVLELAAIEQEQKRLAESWPGNSLEHQHALPAPAATAAEQSAAEDHIQSPPGVRSAARPRGAASVRLQAIDEEPQPASSSSPPLPAASPADSDIPLPVRLVMKDEEAEGESGASGSSARPSSGASFRPVMRLTKPFSCRPAPQQPSSAVGRRPAQRTAQSGSSLRSTAASPLLSIARLLSTSRSSPSVHSNTTRAAGSGHSRRDEEGKLQTQRKGYQGGW